METFTKGISNHTKKDDLKSIKGSDLELDLAPFIGDWTNTKEDSGQLPKVILSLDDGIMKLHAFGAGENNLIDFGKTECRVFSDGADSNVSMAFFADYKFENMNVEITANVKLGVLVVQTYTTFKDRSSRQNYYAREFYGPTQ